MKCWDRFYFYFNSSSVDKFLSSFCRVGNTSLVRNSWWIWLWLYDCREWFSDAHNYSLNNAKMLIRLKIHLSADMLPVHLRNWNQASLTVGSHEIQFSSHDTLILVSLCTSWSMLYNIQWSLTTVLFFFSNMLLSPTAVFFFTFYFWLWLLSVVSKMTQKSQILLLSPDIFAGLVSRILTWQILAIQFYSSVQLSLDL